MSYIVALTGGVASGKTTIACQFAARGIELIDADVIAREVVTPGTPALEAIRQHFGDRVLRDDGQLDRQWLRERIFAQPEDRHWLNQLLHSQIHQLTQQRFHAVRSPWALWVVPLLVENKLYTEAQRVLVVDIDTETQRQRLIGRDHISEQLANQMIAAQSSREQRLAIADDVLDNRLSPQELEQQIAALDHQYRQLARQHLEMGNL